MVKTEFLIETISPEAKYPYFGISKRTGNVVLFTGVNTGIVVHHATSTYGLGHHSTEWSEDGFSRIISGTLQIR